MAVKAEPGERSATVIELKEAPRRAHLDELVRRYFPMVYNTCLRITRNRHDAEDASQAVFLCLATQLKESNKIQAFGPWLYQVACRTSIDLYRRRKCRRSHELPADNLDHFAPPPTDLELQVDLEEIRPKLMTALNALKPRYRLPLILQYFGGLTHEELAEELGCTRTSLRVRLHRGHKMLRETLERRGVALSGVSLGFALTAIVQNQVSNSLITSTIHLGHYASNYGVASCALPADLIAAASCQAARPARLKLIIALMSVGLAGLGLGSPAIARLVQELRSLHHQSPLEQLRIPVPTLQGPLPSFSEVSKPVVPQSFGSSTASEPTAIPDEPPLAEDQPDLSPARNDSPNRCPDLRPSMASRPPIDSQTIPPSAPPATSTGNLPRWSTPQSTPPVAVRSSAPTYVPPSPYQNPASQLDNRYPIASSPRSGRSIASTATPQPPNNPVTPTPPPKAEPPQIVAAVPGIGMGTVTVHPGTVSIWNQKTPYPYAPVESNFMLADASTGRQLTTMSLQTRTAGYQYDAARTLYDSLSSSAFQVLSRTTRLVNNGQVIAWGTRQNLSSYSWIENRIDNPLTGVNGWFARDSGILTLPNLHLLRGTGRYYWGESPLDADRQPDLINSVALDIKSPRESNLSISLLATDLFRNLPQEHRFLGIWSLAGVPQQVDEVGLTIRYDTTRLAWENLNETAVKLWYFQNNAWTHVTDGVTLDLNHALISGQVPSDTRYFAVSTPEPGTAVLMGMAASTLLLRRRRRRQPQA